MLTLAFDTVADHGSVALGSDGEVLGVRTFTDRRHAAELLPAATDLLREAGCGLGDLGRLVVGNGPGSFTGVRIGFATAYGIRRSRAVDTFTIPSIAAAAAAVGRRRGGVVAALYDALRGDAFVGVYRFAGERIETVAGPELAPVAELGHRYPGVERITGEPALLATPPVMSWIAAGPARCDAMVSTAVAMLEMSGSGIQMTPVGPGLDFTPDYGRPAEAQVRWEREHGHELPGA